MKKINLFKLVIFVTLFSLIITFSQFLINNILLKSNHFHGIDKVFHQKEQFLKDVYLEGNYLLDNLDLDKFDYRDLDEINYYFNTNYKIDNITFIFNDSAKKIQQKKSSSTLDIDKKQIDLFINSSKNKMTTSIYLKKKNGKITLPHVPKISFLKKIYKEEKNIGVLVVQYNLKYALRNFFNSLKYDFILLDQIGNSIYSSKHLNHYENSSSLAVLENYKDEILNKEKYSNDKLYSKRLSVNMNNGYILVALLNKEYIENNQYFTIKSNLINFLFTFLISSVILFILVYVIEDSLKNLSETRKISKKLRKLNKFSNLAEEVAQVGLWEVDEFNNVTWNKWMFNILELSDDKTKPSYEMFVSLVHPEDQSKFDKQYKYSKYEKDENIVVYRILTKNSTIKWVEQRWKHYYKLNGDFKKTIGSLYDITDRKVLEDKINHKNSDLEMLLNSTVDAISLIDLNMKFVYFNKSFEKTLGYSKKELLEMNYLDLFLKEDKENVKMLLIELIEEKNNLNYDKKQIAKDGTIFNLSSILKLMPNEELILISSRNITNSVKDHEKYLINQSRMANIGEMLIDLTYQWRQPLSVVSTSASFLKLEHELGTTHKDETIDVLTRIIDTVNKLSNNIDDFKYYVEEEKSSSKFLLNDAIEKVFIILENQLFENEIIIKKDFDENIEIDNLENAFMQVLVNLIKNSIEALQEFSKQKKIIMLSTSLQKDKVEITVTDNAHGISNQVLPLIFNEFFTTKTGEKSNGLGLFLSKKIVNSKLRGDIIAQNIEFDYEDESYKGVCFKISIPLLT